MQILESCQDYIALITFIVLILFIFNATIIGKVRDGTSIRSFSKVVDLRNKREYAFNSFYWPFFKNKVLFKCRKNGQNLYVKDFSSINKSP